MRKILFTVAVALASAFTLLQTAGAAEARAVEVHDFDVYVDTPSGFVFVKLPAGWKFVGKVEAAELARGLPGHVLTALLVPEADADAAVLAQRSPPARPAVKTP